MNGFWVWDIFQLVRSDYVRTTKNVLFVELLTINRASFAYLGIKIVWTDPPKESPVIKLFKLGTINEIERWLSSHVPNDQQ